jgi:hypothetical protein
MSGQTELSESRPGTTGSMVRAAFWLAGGAFFGSLALVLWNRRALKSMREAEEMPVEPPQPRNDDGIY